MDRAKWSISGCTNGIWGSEPNGDEDIICLRVADFDRTSLKINTDKLTTRSVPLSDRVKRLLCNGDLLIEKSGGGEQQLVGTVVQFDKQFDAVTSNFIARLVPSTGVVPRFLVYVHSHLYSGRVNLRSIKQTTGIQNLDTQSYFDEVIAYPRTEEQEAIARFLDFKTEQIDVLIGKRLVLLEKLAEKRKALICHAVTKGIRQAVSMKHSEAPWLGLIPRHWKVLPLKFAVMFQRGHDLPAADRVAGSVPLVSSSGISSTHDVARAKGPGIVTGRYGTIGEFTYIEEDYWPLNTTLYSVETYGNNVRYLWYMVQLLTDIFIVNSKKGAVPGVDRNDLHPVSTALPPTDEQPEIVDYLDRETQKLDEQVLRIKEVIERTLEYRSALISEAVTGRIDVRHVSIPELEVSANSGIEA